MSTPTKWCPRCAEDRPVGEFYANSGRSDGLSPLCVVHSRLATNESNRAKRAAFIAAMGGKCERCGIKDPRVLQVDHVLGDGRVEEVKNRASARFYAKVLADRASYALLCANCNQIKKCEQNETVGERVYPRQVPTVRLQGVGRGTAPGTREALARARTSEHQAVAGRAKKGKPNPKVAAARKGTKLVDGHWVRPDR